MASKKPPSKQLTLFDIGLDAPIAKPARHLKLPQASHSATEVTPEVRHVGTIEILGPIGRSEHRQVPGPFEKESYRLYLRLLAEVRSLSVRTAYATFLVVALVIFGAKIDKTILHFLEVRAISHGLIVGVVGWGTVLLASYTLMRAAFTFKKKRDSGAFYQGVLRFSSNPFLTVFGTISTVVYIAAVSGAILLTLILAKAQMVEVVIFILKNLQMVIFIGPWDTKTIPLQ